MSDETPNPLDELQTRLTACIADNNVKTAMIARQELAIRFLRDANQTQHMLVLKLQAHIAELGCTRPTGGATPVSEKK